MDGFPHGLVAHYVAHEELRELQTKKVNVMKVLCCCEASNEMG